VHAMASGQGCSSDDPAWKASALMRGSNADATPTQQAANTTAIMTSSVTLGRGAPSVP
jgi:hypothetical protein